MVAAIWAAHGENGGGILPPANKEKILIDDSVRFQSFWFSGMMPTFLCDKLLIIYRVITKGILPCQKSFHEGYRESAREFVNFSFAREGFQSRMKANY